MKMDLTNKTQAPLEETKIFLHSTHRVDTKSDDFIAAVEESGIVSSE